MFAGAYMGRKRIFPMLSLDGARRTKPLKGASPRLFRPMVPDFLHGAPPTDACAAFIKESRMKFVNARELDRKSGCTLGRTWGTRPITFEIGVTLRMPPVQSLTLEIDVTWGSHVSTFPLMWVYFWAV
jgi:hypothetical protein